MLKSRCDLNELKSVLFGLVLQNIQATAHSWAELQIKKQVSDEYKILIS